MQIHCPICSTSIDVSEDHAGHKGRCVKCSTKFIIPDGPGGNIEILERGEIIQAQSESDNDSSSSVPALNAPALNAPALNVPAATSHATVRPRYQKKSGSPIGFLFIVVLISAAGAGIYFHLSGKKITISNTNGETTGKGAGEKIVKAPAKVTEKKKIEVSGEVEDPDLTDSVVPFKVPLSDDEVFEFTDEARTRSLEFLASNDQEKRESVYTAFRSLGDNYKETYEGLLRNIRNKHLISLNDKSSAIKKIK